VGGEIMFQLEGGRPGDRRGFLHKSFIGRAVGSVIKTAIPIVGAVGEGAKFVRGLTGGPKGRKPARKTIPRSETARVSFGGEQGKQMGRNLKFPGALTRGENGRQFMFEDFGPKPIVTENGGCPPPLIVNPRTGNCIAPTSPRGAELFAQQPIAGQFGAGFIPGSRIVDVATCGKKQVLGADGICYAKAGFNNKNRMWPKGRRPLLTGGDLNAIRIAAAAGKTVERTATRLRKMGMMKPLPKRTTRAHAHARPVAAVSVAQ